MQNKITLFEYTDDVIVRELKVYAIQVSPGESTLVCRKAADRIEFMKMGLEKLQNMVQRLPLAYREDLLHLVEDIIDGDHV